MIKEGIFAWSTLEDAIPKRITSQWEDAFSKNPHRNLRGGYSLTHCPIHRTYFDRTEEPCWQCYRKYK